MEVAPVNTNHVEKPPVERFSFSGHETFPLRVAWLPKAVIAVSHGKDPFSDPREGMRILGLGKNMVTALQCWSDYFVVKMVSGRLPNLERLFSAPTVLIRFSRTNVRFGSYIGGHLPIVPDPFLPGTGLLTSARSLNSA